MEIKKKEFLWLGILTALLLSAFFLYAGIQEKEEKISALRTENETAESYAAHAGEKKAAKLFTRGEDALRDALGDAEQSGITITGVSEELPEETEHGRILKMKIKGSGSFSQVLSLFDIIHMKKHWMTAELLRAEKHGGSLRFEMELAVYQGKAAES